MARAQATTDHNVIRRWIETRKGHPSIVRATEGKKRGSAGLLRVDFEPAEESLEEISWDDFFDTFDSNGLAFLYQDEASGGPSRFHKFVSRDSVDEDSEQKASPTQSSKTKNSGKKTRQARPAEEEEAEEVDEEEIDDLDEDEEEDEDLDEDEDDDDDDDDEIDDEDEDEEEEEEVKPKRKR
jgi:hypothetical protein